MISVKWNRRLGRSNILSAITAAAIPYTKQVSFLLQSLLQKS